MTEQVNLQRRPFQEGSLQQRRDVLLKTTLAALAEEDDATLRLVLNSQHPADLADLLRVLDEEDQQTVVQLIAEPLAARALADSDTPTMLSVTEDLDDAILTDLVEEMAPDDAADLLGDLPNEQSEKLLDLMAEGEAAAVRELLEHDEDSGGGIMTSRLVSVPVSATVSEAIAHLRQWARDGGEELQSLFVIDEGGALQRHRASQPAHPRPTRHPHPRARRRSAGFSNSRSGPGRNRRDFPRLRSLRHSRCR